MEEEETTHEEEETAEEAGDKLYDSRLALDDSHSATLSLKLHWFNLCGIGFFPSA